ncbi:MAG: type II secretion system protein M [Burkholderiales bacterium]|nr:type II secretion system protein M [Burkholderiales bacterium]
MANAWDRASKRERTLLGVAALVVLFAAGWAWLWQPMNADITRLQRDLPRAKSTLDAARAQADDLVALQRVTVPVKSADPRSAVERVLGERGLRSEVTSLDVQDGRVRMTFAAVRFDALPALLATLATADALRVVDAVLTARVEPGIVRAELTLGR